MERLRANRSIQIVGEDQVGTTNAESFVLKVKGDGEGLVEAVRINGNNRAVALAGVLTVSGTGTQQ